MLTCTFLSLFPFSGMRPDTSKQCTLFSSTPSQKLWTLLRSQFPPPSLSGPKLQPLQNNVPLFLSRAHSPCIYPRLPEASQTFKASLLHIQDENLFSLLRFWENSTLSHFAYELGCTHFLQAQPLHSAEGLPLPRALAHQQCSNYLAQVRAALENAEMLHGTGCPQSKPETLNWALASQTAGMSRVTSLPSLQNDLNLLVLLDLHNL